LKLGKKTEEDMKTLYKDVTEVTREVANARGFDLVLQYNDATTLEDFMSSQNIARKLQTGALMPLSAVDGMDISEEIVTLLNKK
jgi:Skp family chaperone for outer membrane proteins